MSSVFSLLSGPMEPFIRHPELAYLVATGFAILWAISVWHSGKFRPRLHVFVLLPALLWVLYGMHEYRANAAGWNIRIDLLIIWPVLAFFSVAAAALGIWEFVVRSPRVQIVKEI